VPERDRRTASDDVRDVRSPEQERCGEAAAEDRGKQKAEAGVGAMCCFEDAARPAGIGIRHVCGVNDRGKEATRAHGQAGEENAAVRHGAGIRWAERGSGAAEGQEDGGWPCGGAMADACGGERIRAMAGDFDGEQAIVGPG